MRAEEVKPYDEGRAKGEQVEAMFDSIAPAYDFMNSAMTFGMHRLWLRKALGKLKEEESKQNRPGTTEIIDLATGTGDVAFKLGSQYPDASILGVDLSEGMLSLARRKLEKGVLADSSESRFRFEQGDCLNLSYPDNSFDILTIAYGVRNFENIGKGFAEFYRVLRPGGRFMILELSRPENRIVRPFYDLYAKGIIPLIGRMVSKDSNAYRYLPASIAAMPPRRRITEMLEEAGFGKVISKPLTLGVVTFYIGEK